MDYIIDLIIDNAIKISSCTICQDDIYIDDMTSTFCCNQVYHEKCLAIYIGMNVYAKCPICHRWIKKDVKEIFDYIFEKEYKLGYMRDKIKLIQNFTQDSYASHNSSLSSPSSIAERSFSPTIRRPHSVPRLELPTPETQEQLLPLMSRPPPTPRHFFDENFLGRRLYCMFDTMNRSSVGYDPSDDEEYLNYLLRRNNYSSYR